MQAERIIAVEYVGQKPTIDIEIDSDDHIFLANGIATSNSHAVGYSLNTYLSAYAKAHFPLEFFTASLAHAKDRLNPTEEVYNLVNDAKNFNIYVQPPNIQLLNKHFDLIDGKIYFGLSDIKHVGESVVDTLTTYKNYLNNWYSFLTIVSDHINSRAVESLINGGALDCYNMPRIEMLFEYTIWGQLSDREKAWVNDTTFCLTDKPLYRMLNSMVIGDHTGKNAGCYNKNRLDKVKGLIESMNEPPYDLFDKPHQIAKLENELLGVCLTANFLDEADETYMANASCEEFNSGFNPKNGHISLAVQIDRVNTTKIKNGPNKGADMCFCTVSDATSICDSIVLFSEAYEKFGNIVTEGNRLLLTGRKTDKGSLSVENVVQI